MRLKGEEFNKVKVKTSNLMKTRNTSAISLLRYSAAFGKLEKFE